jgi:ribosomal protein S18 acetylase RimI-like enzyme
MWNDLQVLEVQSIGRSDWLRLQDIRLEALRVSPDNFLSTYEVEKTYGEERWLAEFSRGDWYIGVLNGSPVGVLGITIEPATNDRYLEYLWTAREARRSGVAQRMLTTVVDRLRESGIPTLFLYVLDGNEAAVALYRRFGFTDNGQPQPLEQRLGRSEQRMKLDLRRPTAVQGTPAAG